MALLFSEVTLTGDGYDTEFLVGGIPREYEDLEGWCAADDFLENLENESDVQVHVEVYLYGEGETVQATPEEIAYFMKQIDMNPHFLSDRCTNIEDVDFSFNSSSNMIWMMISLPCRRRQWICWMQNPLAGNFA